MPTIIRNVYDTAISMPYPFRGVLAPGQLITLNLTVAQIIAMVNTLPMAGLRLTETDHAANFDSSYMPGPLSGSGTNEFTGSGTILSVLDTETSLGSGTKNPIKGFVGSGQTVDGATPVTLATFSPVPNSCGDVAVTVQGLDVTGAPPIPGNMYRADFPFTFIRVGSAAPTLVGSPAAKNVLSDGAGSTYTVQVVISGNTILVQVIGNAATTVDWTVIGQLQPGS